MLVRSAMLPNPLVVAPSTSLLGFIDRVLDSNQTTAAVVEGDRLLGIVSVHDIFRLILPTYVDRDARLADVLRESYFDEKFAEFAHTPVSDVMTTEVNCAEPDDAVMTVVALVVHKQHKTIPVVEGDRYLGSVTRRSVLRKVTQAAPGFRSPD